MEGRGARLAAAGAVLVVAIVLVAVGSQRTRHALASNFVRAQTFPAVVPPGGRGCQPGERVPAGTAGVQVHAGTDGRPGPRLELTLRGPDGDAATGVLPAGWKQGDVVVPVKRTGRIEGAEVCLRNLGDAPLAIGGGPGLGPGALVDGKPATGAIRLTYLEPEARSWWSFAGDVADRVETVRDAPPGALTLPLFAALALAVMAGAVALVLREARR